MTHPDEWPLVPIRDIGRVVTGRTPPDAREEFFGGDVPFVTPSDMDGSRTLYRAARNLSPKGAEQLARVVLPHGIAVSCIGWQMGKALWMNRSFATNQQINSVVSKPQLANDLFLYYSLSTRRQEIFRLGSGGSRTPIVNKGTFENLLVALPPMDEQRAIAAVLGSLDDKIEQNRRTGRKLEELARAVFKAWFVDFEPVKAKAAGAAGFPGLPAATFAALPKTLKDSLLGLVPEGWAVATIKDRASAIQYGLTTSATEEAIGPRFLRITDIRGGSVDWGTVPYCMATAMEAQKYRLVDGDIVVARTGASTGENMYVIDPPVECVFASYLVRFQFADRGVARLVGAFMRTETYQSFVTGSIGGSAQPNANAQTLASSPLVFPPLEISNAYYDLVHPLDLKRAADARESAKLATLRDYLLPRLLSGRVRVGEAEGGQRGER